MYEDLEPLANLRINKAVERFIEERNRKLVEKRAEMNRRGLIHSGPMEAARLDILATASENECRLIADTWVELLTRKNGSLSRDDLTFIMTKVEACTTTRAQQLTSAMNQPTGGMPLLLPTNYWAETADMRMRKAAGDVRRDLEIHFREQEAFPREKEPSQMPGSSQLNIQNANISNLNLGTQVGTINAALQMLSAESNDHQALADAIKQLTEAVVSDAQLKDAQKHDAVEALSTLAKEAERGKGQPSVTARALITYLPSLLSLSADLVTLWDKFGPTVRAFFGV